MGETALRGGLVTVVMDATRNTWVPLAAFFLRTGAKVVPVRTDPVNFAYRVDDNEGTMCPMSSTTVAAEVRERVLRSRDRFWRPEDFEASPEAVAQALSRMVRTGELRRVRRGLYWRGSPTRLGMAPPPLRRLTGEVVTGPGSGPAGSSAALVLGLSTQVARREAIAVPARAPRDLGPVHFVSRAAATKRRDERLRPLEVALLEVLRDWDRVVEVPVSDAFDRIARLAETGKVRLDRLARASATEPPRARERLRRLLDGIGHPEMADAVRPARSASVHRDRVLAG
jgi:hypothetical protein